MKDPVKVLRDEHALLLQSIHVVRQIQAVRDNDIYRGLVRDAILFLRNFTELYHHPKEEDVFYPMLKNRAQNMSPDFIHEICDRHEDFKALMGEIENHYAMYDYPALRKKFGDYLRMLATHIETENRLVLSVAGSLLNAGERAKIIRAFEEIDNREGEKEYLKRQFRKLSTQLHT
jgi:hemerythrin-like domain-containing protein